MLTVYSAPWCFHCRETIDFLKETNICFTLVQIEEASPEIVEKVVEVNGGDDWVVPTLEYNGQWRPGQFFNEALLTADLKKMGVISK
ncbi:MAG: glutaredoxin family protein [Deltaproteobacteria bacterium]|nr:glutaredoxin family protein [Deltaproteobacteria bacterium]